MSLDTMVDIAACLGITLDYIIFGDEAKNLSKESTALLVYLENCDEEKRRKTMELLKVYLSE